MANGPRLNVKPVVWGGGDDMRVILDTNILSFLLVKEASDQIDNFLEEVTRFYKEKNVSFQKTISMVSVFECLREGDYVKYYELIEKFECVELDGKVNFTAAMMQQYLKKHGDSNRDIADLYIGATSIISCSSILTANPDDFSPKFFKELSIKNISWKESIVVEM